LKLKVYATPNGVELEFFATSNRTYSILHRLTPGAGDWIVLTNFAMEATNRVMSTPIEPLAGQSKFYRVVTPALP
jgi:hypothetical protein